MYEMYPWPVMCPSRLPPMYFEPSFHAYMPSPLFAPSFHDPMKTSPVRLQLQYSMHASARELAAVIMPHSGHTRLDNRKAKQAVLRISYR